MSEWVSVYDRLPEKSGYVLVWDGTDTFLADYNAKAESFDVPGEDEFNDDPQYWMQIPDPPRGRKIIRAELHDDESGGHLVYQGRRYHREEE